MDYYLAIDIGASSGRHILGHLENEKIVLEEIYRFSNSFHNKNGILCWDEEYLFAEIVAGIKKCRNEGKIPVSIGIDTWAVDFVLLDEEYKMLGDMVSYRDERTIGMDREVYKVIDEEQLYYRTGIQKQTFNTIYQLMAVKKGDPDLLDRAQYFLMVPDYLHFRLTNVMSNEYTNATSTQLVNPSTCNWDFDLIEKIGIPTHIFQNIKQPGTVLGYLTKEIADMVGFQCRVVLPATHDTASAVMAVPSSSENILYISSGTWSLMGVERKEADCSRKSMEHNFTNEGGYGKTFRYLKNIMGLWMIQSLKRELKDEYSFEQLCDMAEMESISSLVDCNDKSFLNPESMIGAVNEYCRRTGQVVPESVGELAAVIYNSLADCYRITLEDIEELTGVHYETLHIVGGGSKAKYLNKITAKAVKREVHAGPFEATSIGNILAQMLADKCFENITYARKSVSKSFPPICY